MKTTRRGHGFTIVELLIIIAVIAILAAISIFAFSGWRKSTAQRIVLSDMEQAVAALEANRNFKNSFPPNLAGTNFAASQESALTLFTNAPSVGVYQNLTSDQNAQLFVNACNANISDTPTNTACKLQGRGGGAKVHVKGTITANTIWNSPVAESDVQLSCGASCDAATAKIISQFKAQGGTFPVYVGVNTPLPDPTLVPNGVADKYCLEGRATDFSDVTFHTRSGSANDIVPGECPSDPDLHYFQ